MQVSAAHTSHPAPTPQWSSLTAVEVEDSLFQGVKDKVAIPLETVAHLARAPSAMYLPKLNKHTGGLDFIRLMPAGAPVSARIVEIIRKLGLEEVYVPSQRLDAVVQLSQEAARQMIEDAEVPTKAKAKLLHEHAKLLATMALQEKIPEASIPQASAYVELAADFVRKVPDAMGNLAQMLTLDYSLYAHSVNVCLFALCFSTYIKLNREETHSLALGALFHDIGKIRITPRVLQKPGPLGADEWLLLRKHTSYGYEMLKKYPDFPGLGLSTVLHHHENMDGSGYPAGLKENELPITSRISKILDCYDAITSTRCYKPAVSGFEAIQIMYHEMSNQLSQDLLTQFIKFLGFLGRKAGRKGSPPTNLRALSH